jgi:hypothetical protein
MSLYRVRTILSGFPGAPGLSTTYHYDGGTPNSTDAQTAVNRVRGAWDVVKTIISPLCLINVSGQVDVISPADGSLVTTLTVTPPATVTGTGASGAAPVEVAAGLVLGTGAVVGGRRLAGRLFVSPLSQLAQTALTPAGGTATTINAFGVALITVSPGTAVAPLHVWHRPKPPGSLTGDSKLVTTAACNINKWFVLRSRRD